MHNATSAIRLVILLAIGLIGFFFLFGQEEIETPWISLRIIADKTLGAAMLWAGHRLYSRWAVTDVWIIALSRMFSDVEQILTRSK